MKKTVYSIYWKIDGGLNSIIWMISIPYILISILGCSNLSHQPEGVFPLDNVRVVIDADLEDAVQFGPKLNCSAYYYANCPDGCLKICIPSYCDDVKCTSDCNGAGSCKSESY